MSGIDALQSVRFVTVKGKRLAILDADGWEALIEWLETLQDLEIARTALQELKAAGNDRERIGWVPWDEAREQLE